MTVKEIDQNVRTAVVNTIGSIYPEFSGHMPLSIKNGICFSLKNAVLGNNCGIGAVFSLTLRSEKHDTLIEHAALLRKNISGAFPEGFIAEIPDQEFSATGVKGAFRWIWESSFDIVITAAKVQK